MITVLAQGGPTPPPQQNNFGDTVSDGVAGPMALLIILLLAIGTVLLIRNMNKRLRRLPAQFPIPAGHGAAVGSTQSGTAASPGAVGASLVADREAAGSAQRVQSNVADAISSDALEVTDAGSGTGESNGSRPE